MKNEYCDLDEVRLRELKIPEIAVGLLTSPFQYNTRDGWVSVPAETFKQFTDVVTAYVVAENQKQGTYEWRDIGDGRPVRVKRCSMCGVAPSNVDDCGDFGNYDCPYFGIGSAPNEGHPLIGTER